MTLQLTINGLTVPGLMRAGFALTNYFCADTFSILIAAGPPPLFDIDTLSVLSTGRIELSGLSARDVPAPTMISGRADTFVADPGFQTVLIEGRDLSACLVDSYIQGDFVNQTASEVVMSIASQYDFVCQVTPTLGNVGRYFGDGYTRLSLGEFSKIRTNWDLIVELAREDNFDAFVVGSTFFYQPVASIFDGVVELRKQDFTTIRLQRKVSVATSIDVKVQSWNVQQQSAYTSSSSTEANDGTVMDSSLPGYLFTSSNLTSSQADGSAARYAREVARLNTVLHFEMPVAPSLLPRTLIRLLDCGSSIDGLYHIDAVERRYSAVAGSTQTIRAVSWPILS